MITVILTYLASIAIGVVALLALANGTDMTSDEERDSEYEN